MRARPKAAIAPVERAPLLEIEDLSVAFPSRRRTVAAVRHVSFRIYPGETLAVVGESGSGKSVTALSILRLVEREGGAISGGAIRFRDEDGGITDLLRCDEAAMRRLRGNRISMIFQEPMTSLNPVLTIGDQLAEAYTRHQGRSRREAFALAGEMLARVHLPDPARRLHQYPHELSGGMRQRVMIAMALACRPQLLIADEPTTALDVTIQAQILGLIRALQAEIGMAVMFITHDMGVVAEMADRVVVLRRGEKIEEAEVGALFRSPEAPYSRALIAAVPRLGSGSPTMDGNQHDRVLDVEGLVTRFPIRKGLLKRVVANVHAVEDVSFHLVAGETLGLVGESGCGKSTVARSIVKLVQPAAGRIRVDGTDVMSLRGTAMRAVRRHLQMVFQDPFASLNPRLDVCDLVTEPLAIHGDLGKAARRDVAAELLRRVGLSPDHLDLYPHQFSGGQRQRLCIARALALRPRVIIADEPVSSLDVSIAAQVTELMRELQEREGIAYLFISHDLAVVERVSHRVAVMHLGRIVETGPTAAVLHDPRHPYTRRLLASVPIADPARKRHVSVTEAIEVESPIRPVGYVPVERPMVDIGDRHFFRESAA